MGAHYFLVAYVPAIQGAVGVRVLRYRRTGQVKTADPILIIHSAADDVVPIALSAILFDRMCKQGQVVERRVLQQGQGHGAAAPGAYAQALVWLADRFDGKPAASTCPNAASSGSTTSTTAAASAG